MLRFLLLLPGFVLTRCVVRRWIFVRFARKVFIALILTQFPVSSVFVPALVFLLLVVLILVQLRFRPYAHAGSNWLEVALLAIALWNYISSVFIGLGSEQFNSLTQLWSLVFAVNLCVKLALLVFLGRRQLYNCCKRSAAEHCCCLIP